MQRPGGRGLHDASASCRAWPGLALPGSTAPQWLAALSLVAHPVGRDSREHEAPSRHTRRFLQPVPKALAVSPPSDERRSELAHWLARTALGDREAFAALYSATSAHLFGVVLRINSHRAQAEDILQDIYIKVWRGAGSFDAARAQPMTWLTSIARHSAIDSLRRAQTDVKTRSTVVVDADGEDSGDLLDAVPDEGAGPLQLLEQAAAARELTHCVKQLSAEQQQCLALAYYQGLSHGEVAEHLAQPLGTVKSWVRRALMALKQCLARAASTETT